MFSRPHINPGVKRPCTRHCSIVDPSRGSVTPGFLIYQVTRVAPPIPPRFPTDRPTGRRPNRPSPFSFSRAFTPLAKICDPKTFRFVPQPPPPFQTNPKRLGSGGRGGGEGIFQDPSGYRHASRLILCAVQKKILKRKELV